MWIQLFGQCRSAVNSIEKKNPDHKNWNARLTFVQIPKTTKKLQLDRTSICN